MVPDEVVIAPRVQVAVASLAEVRAVLVLLRGFGGGARLAVQHGEGAVAPIAGAVALGIQRQPVLQGPWRWSAEPEPAAGPSVLSRQLREGERGVGAGECGGCLRGTGRGTGSWRDGVRWLEEAEDDGGGGAGGGRGL